MSTLVAQTISNGTVSTSSANVIQGSAKAWVNFDGTSGSIRASYNVSSVTRVATGEYTINYTNAFADTNYATIASTSMWYNTNWNYGVSLNTSTSAGNQVVPTTTSTRLFQYTPSGSYDPIWFSFAAFR
jgi:hypothetical protein